MDEAQSRITTLLNRVVADQPEGVDELMLAVQNELRGLAGKMLSGESPAHTLQATALVNEAYLRMIDQNEVDWRGKTHFFAISARMMRRILVDHARKNLREKRGGGRSRLELTPDLCISNRQEEDILIVEDVLRKLTELDSRQAEIVELRFFGGLAVQEIADVLDVSKRTVESDWTLARAWLRRELSNQDDTGQGEQL